MVSLLLTLDPKKRPRCRRHIVFAALANGLAAGPERRRRPQVSRWLLAAATVVGTVPVGAQTVVADLGWGGIGDYVVVSRSNDRSSVCDEYINPNALHVPGCATPDRGVGDGWSAPFSDGRGLLAGLGIEFDIAGPWKVAFDYSQTDSVFDQTVASTDAQGVDFEKLTGEVVAGREWLGTLTTRGLHGVLVLYPLQESRLRPYGGVGVGYAMLRADFGWNWRRNADPLAITTGRDQPNFEEIRRNLAGTSSTGSFVFREKAYVPVYVLGVDLAVNDRFSVGLRARRLRYPSLGVGPYVGATLRDHVPNLRLDGSEPVSAWSTLPRTNVTTVSVVLKYHLRTQNGRPGRSIVNVPDRTARTGRSRPAAQAYNRQQEGRMISAPDRGRTGAGVASPRWPLHLVFGRRVDDTAPKNLQTHKATGKTEEALLSNDRSQAESAFVGSRL